MGTGIVLVPIDEALAVVVEAGAPAGRVAFALPAALGADERVFGGQGCAGDVANSALPLPPQREGASGSLRQRAR